MDSSILIVNNIDSVGKINAIARQINSGDIDRFLCDIVAARCLALLKIEPRGKISFDLYYYSAIHNCRLFFESIATPDDLVRSIKEHRNHFPYRVYGTIAGVSPELVDYENNYVADNIALVVWAMMQYHADCDIKNMVLRELKDDKLLCKRIRKTVSELRRNPGWTREKSKSL